MEELEQLRAGVSCFNLFDLKRPNKGEPSMEEECV